MTKTEIMRRLNLTHALGQLGFTESEVDSMRRISNTLQRWHALECGTDSGCIERDEKTGLPYWVNHAARVVTRRRVADREAGAIRRLSKIMRDRETRLKLPHGGRNWICDDGTVDIVEDGEVTRQNLPPGAAILDTYIQTDPRGAALYILRPGDVPPGADPASYYTRGICVY